MGVRFRRFANRTSESIFGVLGALVCLFTALGWTLGSRKLAMVVQATQSRSAEWSLYLAPVCILLLGVGLIRRSRLAALIWVLFSGFAGIRLLRAGLAEDSMFALLTCAALAIGLLLIAGAMVSQRSRLERWI